MSFLSAYNLNVTLSGSPILKGISLDIEPGTWTGVLGPNGSGKTTLLKAIAGLLPYEGNLTLEPKSIDEWAPRDLARRIAFVRQTHTLSFDFKVGELVLLGRSPHKSSLSSYNRRDFDLCKEALSGVDLDGFADRPYASLSGGEQQRVFLAQALVQEADILLLDEPTTYLDVHHQYEFLEAARSMVKKGKTVIGAFHDLELAARFSDSLLVLNEGRVITHGNPQEVLDEDLLASVFRMEADVASGPNEALRIRYAAPIRTD